MSNGCRSSAAASRIFTPARRKCEAARGEGKAGKGGKRQRGAAPDPAGGDNLPRTPMIPLCGMLGKACASSSVEAEGDGGTPKREEASDDVRASRSVHACPFGPACGGRPLFPLRGISGIKERWQEVFGKGRGTTRRALFVARRCLCVFGGNQGTGGRSSSSASSSAAVFAAALRASEKNSRGYPGCFMV